MPTDSERIAKLEEEVKQLNEQITGLANKLTRVPDSILVGPTNPAPRRIAKLKPTK